MSKLKDKTTLNCVYRDDQAERIKQIAKMTGESQSWVVRRLADSAMTQTYREAVGIQDARLNQANLIAAA